MKKCTECMIQHILKHVTTEIWKDAINDFILICIF